METPKVSMNEKVEVIGRMAASGSSIAEMSDYLKSTEQPTLEHQIQATIEQHDNVVVDEPEVRVYETKTSRKLASGEIKEYTLRHHYVVKKKPGPSATSLKVQAANLRAKIAKTIMPFSLKTLTKLSKYCDMTAEMEKPRPVVVTSYAWSPIILADCIATKRDTKNEAMIKILDIELEGLYRLCDANHDIGKTMWDYSGAIWQYIRDKRDQIKIMIETAMNDKTFCHPMGNKVIFETVIKEMFAFCEEAEMWTNIS